VPALLLGFPARSGGVIVAAGLLGAAAFPPLGLWPLTLVSTALLLFVIRDADTLVARNLGLLYGLVYGLGTMYWLFALFGARAVPLVGLMAAYFGLLATLVALTRGTNPWARAALVAVFAVAIEWLRGDAWYLRFPWYTPPHALAAAPMWVSLVRWFGVYGLSGAIWFLAAAGAFRQPAFWLGLLLLPAGSFLLPSLPPPDRRVLLVQAEGDGAVQAVIPTAPAEHVDLAVLPEYAYTRSPKAALASPLGPAGLAQRLQCPVVFGAVEGDYLNPPFSNVAVVIDMAGNILGTFPKQRPVPLIADGVPGDRRPVFPLDQGVLGVAICYDFDAPEVAGWLVRHGATVLVAPTMDAIEWTATQHDHHELLCRLRAIENDRWFLRATTSGRSEVIDPHGIPSADGVEVGKTGYIVLPYGHRTSTPPGSWASALGPAAAGVTVAFLLWTWVRRPRRRRHDYSPPAPGHQR
jgi:apolipoprotein N-acyltransferase